LTLPALVAYRANLYASVDGGELVPVGTAASDKRYATLDWSLLESAKRTGLHHIRFRAEITYDRSRLPAETRDLQDVVYAIYDPTADTNLDTRYYEMSAKNVSARRLDAALPDVPFATWFRDLVTPYAAGRKNGGQEWRITYCDELSAEPDWVPRRRDLCTVTYFLLEGGWGEIWLRTGRIELTNNEARWLAEGPTVEGILLQDSIGTEVSDGLAALPALLAGPPSSWPSADLSVVPEDIAVTRTATTLHIAAVIRNYGNAPSRGAEVVFNAVTSATDRGITRTSVVDVPPGGTTEIEVSMPFSAPYGAVLAQVSQMSEHAHGRWTPDPTPYDDVAWRVISPERAPKGFAASLLKLCGPICRGL